MGLYSSHCDDKAMIVTFPQDDYVCHIVMRGLCSSRCDVTMFVRLWRYYVHHITTLLCFSCCNFWSCWLDCNIGLCLLECDTNMFVTFWQLGNVLHITTIELWLSHCNVNMFFRMWLYYFHHIATIPLCWSHCDGGAMFVMLQRLGFLLDCNIMLCVLECDATMFITLWQYGNVRHIVMTRLCCSHHDDRDIFVTLQCRVFVCHIMAIE
jgi:hypothetical protein